MTLYAVRLYCPYEGKKFLKHVEAPTEGLAVKKILGMDISCPYDPRHIFTVEEQQLIGVYPSKVMPPPPYKLLPEEEMEKLEWLRGARIPEDKPLPKGARRKPETTITLETAIPDAIITFIWKQPVDSPEYPDREWEVRYRRDVFSKFYHYAKRLAQTDLKAAVKYLIEHTSGLTSKQIADILEKGYYPTYRVIIELLGPEQIRQMRREVKEQATLLKWMPPETQEILKKMEEIEKERRKPQIRIGPAWLGAATFYPLKFPTEKELLEDLKSILTLEHYAPTPEEWKMMEEEMRKQREAWLKQSITYWV